MKIMIRIKHFSLFRDYAKKIKSLDHPEQHEIGILFQQHPLRNYFI